MSSPSKKNVELLQRSTSQDGSRSNEAKPFISNDELNSPPIDVEHTKPPVSAFATNNNPDFFQQAIKFTFAFSGLLISYLTWGYMQELIMTTEFEPTTHSPDVRFPSASFCVFFNRFL